MGKDSPLQDVSDPRRPLRVVVAGLGFGLAVHLPGWSRRSDVRIVGITSRRFTKAQDVAREHGIPVAARSVEELLALDPDVLSAALPPDVAAEAAAVAFERGVAVLGEKPIASDLGRAASLIASAEAVPTAVNFSFPELATFRELRRLIAEEDLGPPIEAHAVWRTESYAHRNRLWGWKTDRARFGGVLSSHASHVVHLAEWLFGPAVSVEAELDDGRTRPFVPPAGIPAWDEASITLSHAAGIVCRASLANAAAGEDVHEWHVRCAGGDYRLSKHGPGIMTNFSLRREKPGSPAEILVRDEHNDAVGGRMFPFQRLLDRFVEAVRANDRCAPDFKDGYRTQFLLKSIEDAAASSRKVAL